MLPFTSDQIQQYRQDGYLLVKNVFRPEILAAYDRDLRAALEVRGDAMLPNKEEGTSTVDIHVRSKEQREIDELEKQGKPVPEELRERVRDRNRTKQGKQRMTIRYKNKAAFLRGYRAAMAKRRKIADARGYKLPEDNIERQLRLQDEVEACDKRIRAAQEKGESPDPADVARMHEARQQVKVAIDETTGERLSQEQLDERGKQYCESPEFRKRVDEKMHISEVNRFFAQMGQAWVHVWHGDDRLRARLVASGIGALLGRAGTELGGCAKMRLFTDQATLKKPWNNAHPLHCMAPFVDFIDMRAVTATLILPPTALDRRHGAFVLFPGSHEILRRVSNDGRDLTLFKAMPPSWDVGEWIRAVPGLRKIRPVEVVAEPNDVLFTHSHLGFSHHPNVTSETVLTHTLFMMPDGVVFSGQRTSWMTQAKSGPLRYYKAGQALRDDAVFPMLYDAFGADTGNDSLGALD